jgi:hypothetical protein
LDGRRIVFGYFVTVNEDGQPLRHDTLTVNVGEPMDFQAILKRAPASASPLFSRETIEAVGGYNEKLIRAQEYEFHVRVAMAGYQFVYSGRPVFFRRTHSSIHRISNRLAANPSAFVEPILDLVAKVDELNNSAYSHQIRRKFAMLFWKIGRKYSRDGDVISARIMWSNARSLGSTEYLSGGRVYHLLYYLVGPEVAERLHFKINLRPLTNRYFGAHS